IEGLDVSYLHVFTYSERDNTLAATMEGKVSMNKRRKRNEILRNLSEEKKRKFYLEHCGEIRPVLLEPGKDPGRLTGWTDNYIRLDVDSDAGAVNWIRDLKIEEHALIYD